MQCKAVLGKLHGAVNKDGREIAALFLELPKRSELPDYYKVIARPINAHLIDERLNRFEYPSVLEFATDVHLMFDNAARFHRNIPEVLIFCRFIIFNCHEQSWGTILGRRFYAAVSVLCSCVFGSGFLLGMYIACKFFYCPRKSSRWQYLRESTNYALCA